MAYLDPLDEEELMMQSLLLNQPPQQQVIQQPQQGPVQQAQAPAPMPQPMPQAQPPIVAEPPPPPVEQPSRLLAEDPRFALQAPGEFEEPHAREKFSNPRRMLWAGILSDMGNVLGSWNGSTFANTNMPGTGFKMMSQAQARNDKLRAANERARQLHSQQQNQYANQMYARAYQDRGFVSQEKARALAQDNIEEARRIQLEQFDKTYGLNFAKLQQAAAGSGIERVIAETELNQKFNKSVENSVAAADNANVLMGQLEVGSVVTDSTALTQLVKTFDPGSVVSGNEKADAAASGMFEDLKGQLARLGGGGRITEATRRDIARSVAALVEYHQQAYEHTRGEWSARLQAGGMDADRVLGTAPGFGQFESSYQSFVNPQTDEPAPVAELSSEEVQTLQDTEEDWLSRSYQTRRR